MKKINIIVISIFIILFSISTYHISYGANETYLTNETTDNLKSEKENNYLQSLLVEDYELYPEFNKNILTYYIVLSPDAKSVNVTANAESEKAKTKITGNTNLNKTENTIKIMVTAENKTTRTYNIIATKQEDNGLSLTSLSIEGNDLSNELDGFNHYCTFNYKTNKDTVDLEVKAIANQDDATIEIVGDRGLKTGENLITIILKNEKNTSVYEVLVNINADDTKAVQATEVKNDDFWNNFKESVTNFFQDVYKVIALLCVIAFILIILIISAIIKLVKSKKADKNRERLRKRVK